MIYHMVILSLKTIYRVACPNQICKHNEREVDTETGWGFSINVSITKRFQ